MTDERVERGAMALIRARDLRWVTIRNSWKDEARRQAAMVIEAADQTWIAALEEGKPK